MLFGLASKAISYIFFQRVVPHTRDCPPYLRRYIYIYIYIYKCVYVWVQFGGCRIPWTTIDNHIKPTLERMVFYSHQLQLSWLAWVAVQLYQPRLEVPAPTGLWTPLVIISQTLYSNFKSFKTKLFQLKLYHQEYMKILKSLIISFYIFNNISFYLLSYDKWVFQVMY